MPGRIDLVLMDTRNPANAAGFLGGLTSRWPTLKSVRLIDFTPDEDAEAPQTSAVLAKPFAPQDLVELAGRLLASR